MSQAEQIEKLFTSCDPSNTGRIGISALVDFLQASLKAAGSDKVLTQEEVDKSLAKITLSEPNTITKDEFLQLVQAGAV